MRRTKRIKAIAVGICTCLIGATALTSCQLPHQHEYLKELEKTVAPTCTAQGYTLHECVCGDKYLDTYVDAIGHDFTDYNPDNNATCETDGTQTARCNRDGCKETDTKKLENSALGHAYTNYVFNNDATYDKDGTETATCEHKGCGKTNTRIAANTKLDSRIEFKTLTVNGTEVTAKTEFTNDTTEFSFVDEIEIFGNVTYVVSKDENGTNVIESNLVTLKVGTNVFYVLEKEGDQTTVYKVTLRRAAKAQKPDEDWTENY